MTAFLWVMVCMLAVDIAGKIVLLARPEGFERRRAFDAVWNTCMLGWAIGLLAS